MNREFRFHVQTEWRKGACENAKTHQSLIEGKAALKISAAREFKGEATAHNPEDLLLSALSSCHMMSYFYVCQQYNIKLLSYHDQAEGILELQPDSSGKFQKVILKPKVVIKDAAQIELAISLHNQAHQLCFIANSVSFEIEIHPEVMNE